MRARYDHEGGVMGVMTEAWTIDQETAERLRAIEEVCRLTVNVEGAVLRAEFTVPLVFRPQHRHLGKHGRRMTARERRRRETRWIQQARRGGRGADARNAARMVLRDGPARALAWLDPARMAAAGLPGRYSAPLRHARRMLEGEDPMGWAVAVAP